MKTVVLTLFLTLTVYTQASGLQPNQPFEVSAGLLYQQGLYYQYTLGRLDAALEAYNQALALSDRESNQSLNDLIHLRQGECLQLLGRSKEHQVVLAALREGKSSTVYSQDFTKYFPPETDLMLQLDLESLRTSPLFKKIVVMGEHDKKELDQITSVLGFDPLTMLSRLSAAVSLSDDRQMPLEYWLVVGEGNLEGFKPNGIIDGLRQSMQVAVKSKNPKSKIDQKKIFGDVSKTRLHGVEVWSVAIPAEKKKKTGSMMIGWAKLDDRTVVTGDMVSMRHFLAAKAGKSPGLMANQKLSKLGPLAAGKSSFWLAALPTEIMLKVDDIKESLGTANLPALDMVLLSGDMDKDVRATAVVWTADNESAKNLSDIARGLIALAQMVRTEEPLVDRLLRSLTVDTEERKVVVSVVLPGELLTKPDELEKALLKKSPRKPHPPNPQPAAHKPKPPVEPKL